MKRKREEFCRGSRKEGYWVGFERFHHEIDGWKREVCGGMKYKIRRLGSGYNRLKKQTFNYLGIIVQFFGLCHMFE